MEKEKFRLFVNVPIADRGTAERLDEKAKSMQISRASIMRIALLEWLAKQNGGKASERQKSVN